MRICKDCFTIVSYTSVSSVLIKFPWHSLTSDTRYSCPRFTLIVCGERKYAVHWWNVCYGKWNWFYVIKTPLIKRNDHWKFQICRTKSILSLKYHIFCGILCAFAHRTEQYWVWRKSVARVTTSMKISDHYYFARRGRMPVELKKYTMTYLWKKRNAWFF